MPVPTPSARHLLGARRGWTAAWMGVGLAAAVLLASAWDQRHARAEDGRFIDLHAAVLAGGLTGGGSAGTADFFHQISGPGVGAEVGLRLLILDLSFRFLQTFDSDGRGGTISYIPMLGPTIEIPVARHMVLRPSLAAGFGFGTPGPAHAPLSADQISAKGLLVSEFSPGMPPMSENFPRRNRIISGLARGVVVVEAAEKSGSLITAQCALDQGREIFAVPGSPLDPRAKGANRLIKEGAVLTESVEDILSVLAPMLGGGFREPDAPWIPPPGMEAEADRIRAAVEEALGPAPVEIDELIRQLRAPPAAVLTVILELELAGRCVRHPGNRVSWC